jgi:hypothetical protein
MRILLILMVMLTAYSAGAEEENLESQYEKFHRQLQGCSGPQQSTCQNKVLLDAIRYAADFARKRHNVRELITLHTNGSCTARGDEELNIYADPEEHQKACDVKFPTSLLCSNFGCAYSTKDSDECTRIRSSRNLPLREACRRVF